MTFTRTLVAAVVSAAAFAAPAHAGTIFQDSFEAPNVSSWQVFQVGVGDSGSWFADLGAGIEIQDESIGLTSAYDGSQYVELDSDNSNGGVAGDTNSGMITLIPFVAGNTYEISFAYKPRTNSAGDNIIQLFALGYDGVSVFADTFLTEVNETTSTLSDWLLVSVLYTAQAGYNAIGFLAAGNDNSLGGFIDLVTVNEVPVPAALPLFLAGLAGFSFASRKQRA
ncbi:MAG: VPLPA-CTERM sorting domain-containing protein [Amphiplicatus sp.]